MFRHFRLIKLAAITLAHIFGRRECGLPRDGRLAGHAGLARPNQGLWSPLVFPRPAFRRPERILRHACRVPHRSVLGSVEVGTRATQETHAFDDDGSIICGIGLVDDRAFAGDAVGRELMAGADPNAASERISACFLREQHQGRKHDRGPLLFLHREHAADGRRPRARGWHIGPAGPLITERTPNGLFANFEQSASPRLNSRAQARSSRKRPRPPTALPHGRE